MTNSSQEKAIREFTVVMRGPSAVVFRERETFPITVQLPDATIRVVYTSRRIRKSEKVALPGHLWIEIAGPAAELDVALETFANVGLMAIPLLAVSANATIGQLEIELGYESTPGISERDFFQAFVPGEREIARPGRVIDVALTSALAAAVQASPDRERLMRAMAQYHLALENWSMESSILAVAHLWMAVEALTKARIRAELQKRGLKDENALADALRVEKRNLDSTIRREMIFQGDAECYSDALDASNGFEHGFQDIGKLRKLTSGVRQRAAACVRREIFEIAALEEGIKEKLLSEPFREPLGDRTLVKYMRGKLLGNGDNLAKPGNAYPILRWTSSIKSPGLDSAEKMQIELNECYQTEFADGIGFKPVRFEVWKAN